FLFFSLFYLVFFFLFTPSPTCAIYTLSLHDALPICNLLFNNISRIFASKHVLDIVNKFEKTEEGKLSGKKDKVDEDEFNEVKVEDRKSTRLNSSHVSISYAVFCLKKKKERVNNIYRN